MLPDFRLSPKSIIFNTSEKIPIFAAANETPTSNEQTAMNAPLRTYRPPAAGTQYHRCSATTRVTPFAHLHIGSFANFPHHSSPITHNSHHSFSAKERDSETGLSYFGSRYYSADLSIWLSVDPMSGKYPSFSPYVYCANNSVKCVDPNGEDWFENELTGDVYYSRDYRKGDEKLIDGEGWKWMGKNDMFGESADDVITANLDKADVYTQDNSYDRVGFSGKNAKEFMSSMGYDIKPSKEKVVVTEYQQMRDYSATGQPLYNYNTREIPTTLKSRYVLKNATASYTITNNVNYTDEQLGPIIRKTTHTEIRQYTYTTNPSTCMKFKNFMKKHSTLFKNIFENIN